MAFDPSTARLLETPVSQPKSSGFDPSTAKPLQFDPSTAKPFEEPEAPGLVRRAQSAFTSRPEPRQSTMGVSDTGFTDPTGKFVDTAIPRPQAQQETGMNVVRGAGERAGDLFGNLIRAGGIALDDPIFRVVAGGPLGIAAEFLPEDNKIKAAQKGVSGGLKESGEALTRLDLGYVPEHTWESVKEAFSEDGALSGSAWAEVGKYAFEQGIKSTPDMVAAFYALPAYITSRSVEGGAERAANKGKDKVELVDALEYAPFALGSALLERIGVKGMTTDVVENVGKEALKEGFKEFAKQTGKEAGKGALKEGGTEFIQEGILEYVGERYGTDAKMSVAEAFEMGVAGAVAGGVYGGATAGATAAGAEMMKGEQPSADMQALDDAVRARNDFPEDLPEQPAPEKPVPKKEPTLADIANATDEELDAMVGAFLADAETTEGAKPEPGLINQPVGKDRREDPARATEGNRRQDTIERKRVADMTPEERERALMVDEQTGVGTRRAYQEAKGYIADDQPVPEGAQGIFRTGGDEFQILARGQEISVDQDSLKYINDNMSPTSGDKALELIGDALRQTFNPADPVAGLAEAQKLLDGAIIKVRKPNGDILELNGVRITHGGPQRTKLAADEALKAAKRAKEAAGERAATGQQPPNVIRRSDTAGAGTEGQRDNQHGTAATDLIADLESGQESQQAPAPAEVSVSATQKGEAGERQEPQQTAAQAEVLKPKTFDSRRPESPQTTPSPEGVSRSEQTKTPAFKKWFGDSKVVDENGEPLVVYHGSTEDSITAFQGEQAPGWFSEGKGLAKIYAEDREGNAGKVYEVYLSIRRPLDLVGRFNMNDFISASELAELIPEAQLPDYGTTERLDAHEFINARNFLDAVRDAGYDGIRALESKTVTWAPVSPEQIKSAIGNRGTFDPKKPSIMDSRSGSTQASRPGTQYAPLVEHSGNLPAARQTEVIMADGRKVPIPKEPIRRQDIVKRLEKAFGVRVYQGRVKGKSRLGFYRTGVGEIRTKHTGHLEVTAHELAHWLDDRYVWIGNLYRDKAYKKEVLSVSYDDKKIHEGYAEFMRLFFTDEAQAMEKAPNFYQAFVDKLKDSPLEAPVKDIQGMMHAWYKQGSLARADSKHGETPEGAVEQITEFREWLSSEAKAQLFDSLANIARVEKTLTGRVGGAFSPYWSARITQRVGAIMDAVIHHGTVGYDRSKNALHFTGESLDDAVLSKIKGRERDFGRYMIGRRAKELKHQGREILYQNDEISAYLDLANKHTDFPRIFQAYQAFNKRMIDLLVQSGVTSKEKAEKIMEINQNHVSFKRVVDSFGKHGKASRQNNPFMRLKGGSANIRNVFETLQENMETFIRLSVMNQFKAQFYHMIDSSNDSAMFAAKIGRDVKPVQMNKSELAAKLNKILGENWRDSGIQIDEDLLADLVMFTAVDPKGNVDFYYKNGEKVFYEIIDGALYKDLVGIDGERMGLTFKVWDTVFGKPKRLLTATATAFNLKFQIRNFLMRDLANRIYFTRARKDNPIRIAGQAFKGLAESFKKSDAYWLARANGLGMESTYVGSQYAHVKKASIAPAFNWWQRITGMKDKAIDNLIEFVGHPEMANRLAEYEQLRSEGKTPREAAIGGIDVSVDFRRRGRHELVRYIANGSAFFNPRVQGLYKIAEEMTNLSKEEKNTYIQRRAAVVAMRALWTTTLPAMALWFFNHDDERYQNLPDDVRDQNFVVFYGPGKDDYFLIAKSFEMGSMFASVPERLLDAIDQEDGRELAESLSLMAAETLSLDPTPSVLQIEREIRENKRWTGAPIIPDWLNDKPMEKSRYFDDRTSQTARWLGEKLNIRPDHLEHRFRGYTSMIGDITLSMTDYMLRQENQVDPKMTYQDYVSKYIGILPKSGEPYRTEAQKDFFELAKEADKVFNTYNDLMKRPGNYDTLDQRLRDYLSPPERQVYYATRDAFESAREIISDLNNTADLVRQDTRLSAEEKRAEMEKIKAGKNQVYEKITKEFSPEKFKELERQIQ